MTDKVDLIIDMTAQTDTSSVDNGMDKLDDKAREALETVSKLEKKLKDVTSAFKAQAGGALDSQINALNTAVTQMTGQIAAIKKAAAAASSGGGGGGGANIPPPPTGGDGEKPRRTARGFRQEVFNSQNGVAGWYEARLTEIRAQAEGFTEAAQEDLKRFENSMRVLRNDAVRRQIEKADKITSRDAVQARKDDERFERERQNAFVLMRREQAKSAFTEMFSREEAARKEEEETIKRRSQSSRDIRAFYEERDKKFIEMRRDQAKSAFTEMFAAEDAAKREEEEAVKARATGSRDIRRFYEERSDALRKNKLRESVETFRELFANEDKNAKLEKEAADRRAESANNIRRFFEERDERLRKNRMRDAVETFREAFAEEDRAAKEQVKSAKERSANSREEARLSRERLKKQKELQDSREASDLANYFGTEDYKRPLGQHTRMLEARGKDPFAGTRDRMNYNYGADMFQTQFGLLQNYMLMGAGLGGAGAVASNVVGLDKELKQFQAITATSDTEMRKFEKTMADVATQTKFTALEVAQASTILGQAGLSAAQVGEAITPITLLATAAGTDLANAVDAVTSTMSIFDLQSHQYGQTANVITAALNQSKLSLDKYILSLQYAGSVAAEAGTDYKELTAIISTMANSGIKNGSTIGTGLRQLFTDIQKPSENFRAVMDRLGITLSDIDINTNTFVGVMQNLAEKGFTGADALQSFEVRAAAAFSTFINNMDEFERFRGGLNSTTAAAEANATQMEALANKWSRFFSTITTTASTAFDPVLYGLGQLIDGFQAPLAAIGKFDAGLKIMGGTLTVLAGGALITKLGGLLVGLSRNFLAAGISAETAAARMGAFGRLGGSLLTAFGGPWGVALSGAVAAVTALTAAWQQYGSETERVARKLDEAKAKVSGSTADADKTKQSLQSIHEEIARVARQADALSRDPIAARLKLQEGRAAFNELGLSIKETTGSIAEYIEGLRRIEGEQRRLLSGQLAGTSADIANNADAERNSMNLYRSKQSMDALSRIILSQQSYVGNTALFDRTYDFSASPQVDAGLYQEMMGRIGERAPRLAEFVRMLNDPDSDPSKIDFGNLKLELRELQKNFPQLADDVSYFNGVISTLQGHVEKLNKLTLDQQRVDAGRRQVKYAQNSPVYQSLERQVVALDVEYPGKRADVDAEKNISARSKALAALDDAFDKRIDDLEAAIEDEKQRLIAGGMKESEAKAALAPLVTSLTDFTGRFANEIGTRSQDIIDQLQKQQRRTTRVNTRRIQNLMEQLKTETDLKVINGIEAQIKAIYSEMMDLDDKLGFAQKQGKPDTDPIHDEVLDRRDALEGSQKTDLADIVARRQKVIEEGQKRTIDAIDGEIDKAKAEYDKLKASAATTTTDNLGKLFDAMNTLMARITDLLNQKASLLGQFATQNSVANGQAPALSSADVGRVIRYVNEGAIRSQKLTSSLEQMVAEAVTSVYGEGYTAQVYSGGQDSHGPNRTGTHAHDQGKAGDFYITGPNGQRVTGDALAPLIQYYLARQYGGVGAEMRGGGIHLDEHSVRTWDYRDKGGQLTTAQAAAMEAGRSGAFPTGLAGRANNLGLNSQSRAFLDVVAQLESANDYYRMNGTERFTGNQHPNRVGAGGTTTAAGRYQMVAGTWEEQARKLGLTDFSPGNQDRAALNLARERFGSGFDQLLANPTAENMQTLIDKLGPTWKALEGQSPEALAAMFQRAMSGQPVQSESVAKAQADQTEQATETAEEQAEQAKLLRDRQKALNKVQLEALSRGTQRIIEDAELASDDPMALQTAMDELKKRSGDLVEKQVQSALDDIPEGMQDEPANVARIAEIRKDAEERVANQVAGLYDRYLEAQRRSMFKESDAARAQVDAAQLPQNEGKYSSYQVDQLQKNAALKEQQATQQYINFLKQQEVTLNQQLNANPSGAQELEIKEKLKVVQDELNAKKAEGAAIDANAAKPPQQGGWGQGMQAGMAGFLQNNGMVQNVTGQWVTSAETIAQNWQGLFDTISGGLQNALMGLANGTMTVQDAFKQMAMSVIQYLMQMIAKMLVVQLMSKMMPGQGAAGAATGAAGGGGGFLGSLLGGGGGGGGGILGSLFGGIGKIFGFAHGTSAVPGVASRDRIPAMLEPGEGVLNRSAMQVIGREQVELLNGRGNRRMSEAPRAPEPRVEKPSRPINIWVADKEQMPSMGPDDVIAIVGDNIQRRGQLRQLVKSIQAGY